MAAYTTIDKPTDYFETKLYAGNDSGQGITMDFAPNWVWLKDRSGTDPHAAYDSVRGALKQLRVNITAIERELAGTVTAFNSDGFTVGNDDGTNDANHNFVSWNWKAGTSFTNDASGTSIGNTDSTGSFNNTAGFSIVSYNGVGSSLDIEIKHGLNTVPAVIITKNLGDANHWAMFHHKNTSAPQTDFLKLSDDVATTDDADIWNDVAPTNAIFTAGDHSSSNRAGDAFIAYCFSEKQGYSKFGSYVGNNNVDGTFVYTGFKPALVIAKNIGASEGWSIFDNKRSTSGANLIDDFLVPNDNGAEVSQNVCDFVSNGFKFRHVDGKYHNNGGTYIYLAFAENPFVTSTGIPTTAR